VNAESSTLRRVAKNTLVPTATSFVNKGLDLIFAVLLARALGPTELGRYTWVVLVVTYFDIVMNFGLAILIARQVARDAASASRYMGAALVIRLVLWGLTLGVALALAGPLAAPLGITEAMGVALVLFTVSIGITNLTGIASAVLNGRELMEYPALVTLLTSIMKLTLGAWVLVNGLGIAGVAAVAVVVTVISGIVLGVLFIRVVGFVRPRPDPRFALELGHGSYPLMVNDLLATLFFRLDGLILRGFAGDQVLGWYGMAYKFIDGLTIVSTNVTLAMFPLLSRLAIRSGKAGSDLARATHLALKALLALAFPIAVGTTLLAEPLIRLVAGESYLPHSAIALQILIWFLPFSFTNALLQYVLIALNRQRFITAAFIVATVANATLNLLLIPRLSYVGAAVTTILSEIVLLAAFLWALRGHLGDLKLPSLVWRPVIAAAVMAPAVWALKDRPLVAIPAGAFLYVVCFLAIGGITRPERDAVAAALLHRSVSATPSV
jgi:O-antigen/teichoic acid export membrane protein